MHKDVVYDSISSNYGADPETELYYIFNDMKNAEYIYLKLKWDLLFIETSSLSGDCDIMSEKYGDDYDDNLPVTPTVRELIRKIPKEELYEHCLQGTAIAVYIRKNYDGLAGTDV